MYAVASSPSAPLLIVVVPFSRFNPQPDLIEKNAISLTQRRTARLSRYVNSLAGVPRETASLESDDSACIVHFLAVYFLPLAAEHQIVPREDSTSLPSLQINPCYFYPAIHSYDNFQPDACFAINNSRFFIEAEAEKKA